MANWVYQAYSLLGILSACITAFLAVYTWKYRTVPGASGFIAFLTITTLWTIGNVMLVNSASSAELFWHNIRFVWIALLPIPWLMFTWQYYDQEKTFSLRSLAALSVLPGITCLVVLHRTFHDKFFDVMNWWYWIHAAYSYFLILLGILFILKAFSRSETWSRRQGFFLLVGIFFPLIVVFLHTFDWIPWYGMDYTSLAFAVTGVSFTRSLFRFHLFDVVPIARTVLIDSLDDPMFVLDTQNRLVDLNNAAERILGRSLSDVLGSPAREIFHPWTHLIERFRDTLSARTAITLEIKGEEYSYDLNLSPIYDTHSQFAGRLFLLRDITEQKRAEAALQEFQQQLESSYQREQERRKLSDTLREAVVIVSSTLEPRRVVGLLLDELQKVVPYHVASVMLVSDDHLIRLVRRSARGDSYRSLHFPIDAYPLNAQVLEEKQPILIPDTRSDSRWSSSSETGEVRSLINTPLLVQERPIGVLFIGRTDDISYTEEDVNILFAFATHVAIAVENARLADQTRNALTDLQNTLERLQRTQQRLVESEKMAALGQLIAGVAHEINTPLGAIRASITNISAALNTSLRELPAVLRQLPHEQQELFLTFVARTVRRRPQLTSREERKLRRKIEAELEDWNVENADDLADTLVDIGVHDKLEPFLPLFQAEESVKIMQAAYHLAIQRHNSDNILTAVERVSKIVFALKSYVHYDHSGEKAATDIIEGIETVLTLYHNQLKHGIEVVKHYADVPPIQCYPDELNQVWTNLIHNAIQAMNGKGTLEIVVKEPTPGPSQEGNSVEISSPKPTSNASQEGNKMPLADSQIPLLGGARGGSKKDEIPLLGGARGGFRDILVHITDSGPGIPDEIKDRIFEPFFTTKSSGEGSGLGLDICRKIIDKHQGKIEVDSQPGRTTFNVWLPVLEQPGCSIVR